MKLKSFGCSFIFGSELTDATCIPGCVIPSKNSYPAYLARHLGYDYQCSARPGSGNLQIAEQVLNHIATNEPAFFVIGWTWIDRFDYWGKDPIWFGSNWQTIMPVDTDKLAKSYYQNLHSEYRDKLTTLMLIRLVIDSLKQKGYPFIMTYIDELMLDQKYYTAPGLVELQEYINPYMTTFEGQTFLEWSRNGDYPIGSGNHPLEAAHQAAGDYIIKVFDKQNTIDC
jgi:hypothetical protein